MKKIKFLAILLVMVMVLPSCATLFKRKVTFTSDTPTADELRVGKMTYYNVTFPFSVRVNGGYGKTKVYAKSGNQEANLAMRKKFRTQFILDALFGLVPGAIDILSANITKPVQKEFHLTFTEPNNIQSNPKTNAIANNAPVQPAIASQPNIKIVNVYYSNVISNNYDNILSLGENQYLTDLKNNSYIRIYTDEQVLLIQNKFAQKGTTSAELQAMKGDQFELRMNNNKEYYLCIVSGGNIQEKTKADFDKKVAKLGLQGDYVYKDKKISQPDSYQQPGVLAPVAAAQIATNTHTAIASDVDKAPVSSVKSPNTFVLIIANEHYTFVDNVDFAIHDGEVFKEYCIKTLGVPERQVWFYQDASAGIISGGIDKMVQAMSLFDNSKAIVYYCGHGIPDEHTGDAYIVPTDGKGTNTATCYSLNKMYTTLAASNAKSVTYFMDACFSGANKEGSMLVAARGVAREAKKETLKGNTVVFSAASGDETAMTYKEKGHGLFTYFLLKKLQETKGDVSYEDLDKYIKDNVKRESFLTNEKVQHPATNVSENAVDSWKQMKLK